MAGAPGVAERQQPKPERVDPTSIDQVFAELTPVPCVLLDSNLHILQASNSYLKQFNLTSDDCNGVSVYDLVRNKCLVPEEASLRRAVEAAITTKKVYATKDVTEGTRLHHWWLRVIPIFKDDDLLYMALEIQNITAEEMKRQLISDQLDTNDTYRILVDTVKDYAIFMLDVKGNVKTWNAGAQLLKGYSPQEIIGRHFSTFYGEDDLLAEKPRIELELCLRDGKVEDESWRYRKDGSRFWANVIITCVYRDGVHIGFSKVTRDLTERKAAESRLISAYEESARLKSVFLANISHEIRTPMHGMLSALTLLMDSSLTPEQRELGSIIEESGSVLLQLINDILDYSKLASGNFSIGSDIIHIGDIIASVVRGFHAIINSGVTFRTSLDPSLPKSAKGDPLRYRQIVQNLVSNAVKFTESGSVDVSASVLKEDLRSYTIRTEITDTGIGVPESGSSTLFKPFTQLDSSVTKKFKGTGLGLSICKSLAGLMGGDIGFTPNPAGQGSTFWFDVKMEKLIEQEQLEALQRSLKCADVSPRDSLLAVRSIAKGKRLLLAEDNPINQKVMSMMLKNLGFEGVEIAVDGAEAVELTQKSHTAYDLILMDINMPVLDGIGATNEIRKADSKVPIIAMTANALKGDVDVYMSKGMNDYIPKPVDRRLLIKALLYWLK
jgi:osomolarity two-component system sensor histidine kinase TcsA